MNRLAKYTLAGLALIGMTFSCTVQNKGASTITPSASETTPRGKNQGLKLENYLVQLDTAKHPGTIEQLAKSFNKLSDSDKSSWLPEYYEAYCYLRLALQTKDLKQVDAYCDHASLLIKSLDHSGEGNTEVMCLQALALSARIRVNVMDRGVTYSTLSNQILEMVIQKDPENPRAYFLRGQNIYNMPDIFGGGKENAKPYFEKSVTCYEQKIEAKELPDWGYQSASLMLEKCQ
ncbi:MAG: hypothetical protein SH848_03920 [Saprospiraceae bacterium]|nr:hypothetical protein [Saprospiraceae bacterium]MDZ4703048.1 hypothetical protein [Saprospiraceae bacterium]